MYAAHFGLRELPFNVTPDPRFLYLNGCYREALAAISYGIDARKGFVSLIGEAGTGKTTLLRRVLDTLEPTTRTVLLLNPTVTFAEILEHILSELGIPSDGANKLALFARLNEFLLEHTRSGGNVALLIDEAQDLTPAVLEELRLLSNLETAQEKILQIVLAGQPELEEMLASPKLRQLRQRVTLRVRLRPLSEPEVRAYVHARLERAGAESQTIFTDEALTRVAALTDGIPRIVNVVCDAALLTAFAAGHHQVTATTIEEAWRDYAPDSVPLKRSVHVPAPPKATSEPAPVQVTVRPPTPAEAPSTPPPVVAAPASPPAVAPPAPPAVEAAIAPPPVEAAPPPPVESEPMPLAPPSPVAPPTQLAPEAPLVRFDRSGTRRDMPEPASKYSTDPHASRLTADPEPAPPWNEPSPSGWSPEPEHAAYGARASRTTLSVPVAAGLVAALAGTLYVASMRDSIFDPSAPLAAVEPAPAAVEPAQARAAVPPSADADDPLPPRTGPLTPQEATTVVDEFRNAYEARDVDRLLGLFAADAAENGRQGLDSIATAYRGSLQLLDHVRYMLPSLAVEPRGAHATVRGPFIITYHRRDGGEGEIRGQAEWQLERRDGRPRIVQLNYRLDPAS
jgi:general secretion pathway protein A